LEAVILPLTRATLRPWQAGDAASLVRHADDREIWRNLRDRFPHPYTAADAEVWLTWATRQAPSTNWAIEVDGEAAGGIGYILGDDVHARTAEIGFWLGRRFWGRGIVTDAVRAVTAYAFAAHDLLRVEAHVFAWNEASMRVLEKAGYEREACLRRAVAKDGAVTDLVIFAVLRPDVPSAAPPPA
jgi:ribosomal-protein-alanine N-acetyltransferase